MKSDTDVTAFLDWLPDGVVIAACRNCGDNGPKQPVLRAAPICRDNATDVSTLLRCGRCGCGFFDQTKLVDYALSPVGGAAALAFYLQQGAGLWSIDSALLRLGLPPGTAYLEVGCGFGFGLDFARRALGWRVQGLDPSPFAQAGKECLDLPIEHRHLVAGNSCGGPYDVIMASELIEHVPDPQALLAVLKGALKPGGILLLSTPDFGSVAPETPPGLLIPLLSVGYHLVLQSRDSLRYILRQAGFATIEVEAAGSQLVARATDGAATWQTRPPDRTVYRQYLSAALAATQVDDDLWFGFAARAFREAVNERDTAEAEQHFVALSQACQRRYGFALEQWQAPQTPLTPSLEEIVASEPVCLGPLLLHRGLQRLGAGEGRAGLVDLFQRAAEAAERLRRALQAIGTDDGDTEDIAWVARAESVLCAASEGAADVPERLEKLGHAPGVEAAVDRIGTLRRRCFVILVNAGYYEQALPLRDVVPALDWLPAPETPLADDQLDALFCGAVLDLQHPSGDLARALELATTLRERCALALTAGRIEGSPVVLLWPALRLEVLALEKLGRVEEARHLRAIQLPVLERLPSAGPPPHDLAPEQPAGRRP